MIQNPNSKNRSNFTSNTWFNTIILIFALIISSSCVELNNPLSVQSVLYLEKELSEISGLAFTGENIFAINDSGNGNYLYQLNNEDFRIVKRYEIPGSVNSDWEDLCYYNGYLYVGNFGNNFGNRKNLSIYGFKVTDLESDYINVTETRFNYEIQSSFLQQPYNHMFDCEAMIAGPEGVITYSKDWKDRTCRLYALTPDSKNYSLSPIDSLNLGFLVTGAFYEKSSNRLFFCGYEDDETYLAIFTDVPEIGFSKHYTKYLVTDLKNRQVESIFVKDNNIYLGSEATIHKQAIYILKVPSK